MGNYFEYTSVSGTISYLKVLKIKNDVVYVRYADGGQGAIPKGRIKRIMRYRLMKHVPKLLGMVKVGI